MRNLTFEFRKSSTQKLLDLANLAVATLIFTQLISKEKIMWSPIVIALTVLFTSHLLHYLLLEIWEQKEQKYDRRIKESSNNLYVDDLICNNSNRSSNGNSTSQGLDTEKKTSTLNQNN